MAKTSRESKDIVLVTYNKFNQSGSANCKRAPAFNLLVK